MATPLDDYPRTPTEDMDFSPDLSEEQVSTDATLEKVDYSQLILPGLEERSEELLLSAAEMRALGVVPQEGELEEYTPLVSKEGSEKRKNGFLVGAASALAAILGVTGLAIASKGEPAPERSNVVPATAPVPGPSTYETEEPVVTLEPEIPPLPEITYRTPELPTSDDPQTLLNQLLRNQQNAMNFALEDPAFSQASLNLGFIPESLNTNYATAVREEVAEMSDFLVQYPAYELLIQGEVLDYEFGATSRQILAHIRYDRASFGVTEATIRYTLSRFPVTPDPNERNLPPQEVWLITGKDTVSPGTYELE